MTAREDAVFNARLAEEAERYEDMKKYMKEIAVWVVVSRLGVAGPEQRGTQLIRSCIQSSGTRTQDGLATGGHGGAAGGDEEVSFFHDGSPVPRESRE